MDEQPTDRNEGVLSLSDLEIADSDYVAEIEEGRYVVSTDDSPPDPTDPSGPPRSSTPEDARYGLDVEASIDGNVSRYHTRSDDIVAVFSELVGWYAAQVDDDLDPARVLRILIAESRLPIGPRSTIETAMERHELTSGDSIGDLLEALSETHR